MGYVTRSCTPIFFTHPPFPLCLNIYRPQSRVGFSKPIFINFIILMNVFQFHNSHVYETKPKQSNNSFNKTCTNEKDLKQDTLDTLSVSHVRTMSTITNKSTYCDETQRTATAYVHKVFNTQHRIILFTFPSQLFA